MLHLFETVEGVADSEGRAEFRGRLPQSPRIISPSQRDQDFLSTKGEADVVFKGLIAATAAVALMATPTMAAASGSAAASAAAAAPASESVDGDSELFGRGGFIVPLIAIVAIILGILAATNDDDDDLPESP